MRAIIGGVPHCCKTVMHCKKNDITVVSGSTTNDESVALYNADLFDCKTCGREMFVPAPKPSHVSTRMPELGEHDIDGRLTPEEVEQSRQYIANLMKGNKQ